MKEQENPNAVDAVDVPLAEPEPEPKPVPEVPIWYKLMMGITQMSAHMKKREHHKVRAGFTKNRGQPRDKAKAKMAKRSRARNRSK